MVNPLKTSMFRLFIAACCLALSGCSLLPDVAHRPSLHNPFPQLSRVAVAPFFNLSDEPTLSGEDVAMAYYAELQTVPGFEVVPVGVVQTAMQANGIELSGPAEARRLAQLLDVDAVVVGAVTDYTPYYPPQMGLRVEWYAANPCFHPIPPGYGLPWGTSEERHIPDRLVLEAEMALAREQLKTQTPSYQKLPPPEPDRAGEASSPSAAPDPVKSDPTGPDGAAALKPLQHEDGDLAAKAAGLVGQVGGDSVFTAVAAASMPPTGLPPNWPDPHGFIPDHPRVAPPACRPSDAPVMRHTAVYRGNDVDFTAALESYYGFRDEARFGGWQSYLQRSEDFVRFCCHMHLWQMLSARGGAGETRVVWRWPRIR